MRKKWLLILSLVAALVMGLVMPSAALAAKPQTAFAASGIACISGPYKSHLAGPPGMEFKEIAVHEPVDGVFLGSDWDPLTGAQLESLHNGWVVFNPEDGSLAGKLVGSFTITAPDGSTLKGRMWGEIYVDPTQTYIRDEGTWMSNSATGSFKGIKADGNWSVEMTWNEDLGTYVGMLTLNGSYR